MSTTLNRGKLDPAFHDFIPWADPYITSLVEKVRRTSGRLLEREEAPRNEAPPPVGFDWDDDSSSDDDTRRGSWLDQ